MHIPTSLRAAIVAMSLLALAACAAPSEGSDASESSDVSITGSGDPSIAATVNGTEITVEQVAERFEQAKKDPQVAEQLKTDTEGTYEASVQATILTQLIVSQLLEQWAEDLDIEATDEEIADERTALIGQMGGQEAFDTAVEESGLSEEDVTVQIRQQVLQKEISAKVGEDAAVSDADIEAFYEENRATRYGEKATARHILVKDKAKAGQIMNQLRKGADFAKIAAKESTDPGSAAQGGELPEFGRGQMVPQFEEAVFAAKAGELVGPVKTEFGYHIIEVIDIKAGQELADVEEEIRGELAQSQGGAALSAELQKRTEDAEVTVNPRFGTWEPCPPPAPTAPPGTPTEEPTAACGPARVEPTEPLGNASETASEGAVGTGTEGPTESIVVPTESATQ